MNREEVIRMATEAGLLEPGYIHGNTVIAELERFAALVAAAERRKHQADIERWKAKAAQSEKWRALALCKDPMQPGKVVQEIQREAMETEREACAQIAEWEPCMTNTPERIAAAIRNRSKP